MTVIYDSSIAGTQVSGVSSLTFSFTNNTGTALVIGVAGDWPSESRVDTIKYGDSNLVVITSNIGYGASWCGGYLMEPATGANNVVITMKSSANITWLNALILSVSGPTGTPAFKLLPVSATTLTRSSTISSQAGGTVVSLALLGTSVISENNNSWRVDSGSNERVAATYVSPWVFKGATKTATYPSTTITWTNNQVGVVTRTSVLMTFSFPPRDTISTPSFYYDFQSDTINSVPNGFTPYADWNWGGSFAVSTVPGDSASEKALSCIKQTYGQEHAYNNTIGKLTLNDQPIEIATKFKVQNANTPSTVTTVPGDTSVVGILAEDSVGSSIAVVLRYSYADQFRIASYSGRDAQYAIAFRAWKITGILTFDTSSPTVTGAMDPEIPPYNYNYTFDSSTFTVGGSYQIINLGSDDWNNIANTTDITYKVGDIITVVNQGASNSGGRGVRKTTTRFQNTGTGDLYVSAEDGIVEGATLYHINGSEIGVIKSIESPTSLTLTTNAKINGNGVQAKLHPDSFVPQTNTWYYVRFRREIGAVYKAKVWPVDSIEPEGWLLDSSIGYPTGYPPLEQQFTTGRLGVTSFSSINHYWAQWGVSLDDSAATLDGTFPPSITNVNTNNILTSTQVTAPISGYHLANVTTATIIQGSISIPQNITIVSETSANLNFIFDTNTYDAKYGSAILRLSSPTGISNKTITIIPPDSRCYRDLTSVNTTKENRLTALPDLDIGDQIEVLSVNGAAISSVNINSDGTFDADSSVISFTCRAWSAADQTWGNPAVQAMVASAVRRRVIVIL